MSNTDTLGRATFHHIKPQSGVLPTDREIRWLKHIERHGAQSSEFLIELTCDTHRCRDTALRALQRLRAGGYLVLPRQQRATARAEFKPYIYDLTRHGKEFLKLHGLAEPTVRPAGHWWHGYAVSAFTGTLDIHLRRSGCEFIPAHTILQRSGAKLAIPTQRRRLLPDQLFAVRYPDGYRAFLLEVDRGTEPLRSSAARKSLAQSIDLYREVFAHNLQHRHFGINASTLVAWVFTNHTRTHSFQAMVQERAGQFAGHFLTKTMPEALAWGNLAQLHRRPWTSGSRAEVVGL